MNNEEVEYRYIVSPNSDFVAYKRGKIVKSEDGQRVFRTIPADENAEGEDVPLENAKLECQLTASEQVRFIWIYGDPFAPISVSVEDVAKRLRKKQYGEE